MDARYILVTLSSSLKTFKWRHSICSDINECDVWSPFKHGNCSDHLNNYTCSCDAGYHGRNCSQGNAKYIQI